MTVNNFNADTPQSKAVENFIKGITSLDISNSEPFMSKDFKFKTFPTIADLPDEPMGGFFARYGKLLSLVKKLEVNVYEAIEAPGKVVLHYTATFHTPDGDTLEYDTLSVITLVEEDGQLKVDEYKDFSDPEKRGNIHGWIAKEVAKKAA